MPGPFSTGSGAAARQKARVSANKPLAANGLIFGVLLRLFFGSNSR